jgi:hypothetical protein
MILTYWKSNVLTSQILQMAEVMTVANRLVRQRPQMTKRLEKVAMSKINVDLTYL